MKARTISKETSDKISFVSYIVPAFADAYKMKVQDAFFLLSARMKMRLPIRNTII